VNKYLHTVVSVGILFTLTHRHLITITPSLKTNKLFCLDLNCYVNIKLGVPQRFYLFGSFANGLSFPLLAVITALTLCPIFITH